LYSLPLQIVNAGGVTGGTDAACFVLPVASLMPNFEKAPGLPLAGIVPRDFPTASIAPMLPDTEQWIEAKHGRRSECVDWAASRRCQVIQAAHPLRPDRHPAAAAGAPLRKRAWSNAELLLLGGGANASSLIPCAEDGP
jgi:hypothetical protein